MQFFNLIVFVIFIFNCRTQDAKEAVNKSHLVVMPTILKLTSFKKPLHARIKRPVLEISI